MVNHDNHYYGKSDSFIPIDLKIDNLDRVSIPTKIVATFDVKHPIHGTTYAVETRSAFESVCLYLSNLHCVELVSIQIEVVSM